MQNNDPFGAIILLIASVFFIYRTYTGFTDGYITGKYGTVYHRDDSPIGYWFGMLISLAAAIGFPVAAVMHFF